MEPPDTPDLAELFCRVNALDRGDFTEWLLCRGMLFGSSGTWWGRRGRRTRPHEGLDLGVYRDGAGRVVRLSGAGEIPIMYGGLVVGVFDDFLGKSIFVKHSVADHEGRALCTVLGHTAPAEGIRAGRALAAGEVVGRVAAAEAAKVSPHLHVTVGWARREIGPDALDWAVIAGGESLELVDPLMLIGSYAVVPAAELFPE